MTQEDKIRSLAKRGDGLNAIEKSDLELSRPVAPTCWPFSQAVPADRATGSRRGHVARSAENSFATWGNSGIGPPHGLGNQLSRRSEVDRCRPRSDRELRMRRQSMKGNAILATGSLVCQAAPRVCGRGCALASVRRYLRHSASSSRRHEQGTRSQNSGIAVSA